MNITVSYTQGNRFHWLPKVTVQRWAIAKPPFNVCYRDIHWGFLLIQFDNEKNP